MPRGSSCSRTGCYRSRWYSSLGDERAARVTQAVFAGELAPSRRSFAKLIEGEALRLHRKPIEAIEAFQAAITLRDQPWLHFLLARAMLDGGRYADAEAELRRCIARRGEIVNSIDDVTALRNIPQLTYYLAKAQDGLGSAEAPASYRAFLTMMHDPDRDDPFVADARRHAH